MKNILQFLGRSEEYSNLCFSNVLCFAAFAVLLNLKVLAYADSNISLASKKSVSETDIYKRAHEKSCLSFFLLYVRHK